MSRKLKLVEVYDSVKGEGTQAGIPMTFVRFSNCNLECSFCDTPYNRVAIEMSVAELLVNLRLREPRWIIFTGGEPMLQLRKDITEPLKMAGISMAIETNGMVWNEAMRDLDYINVSPKGPQNPLALGLIAYSKDRPLDEIRYLIATAQDDLYDTGAQAIWTTISPMMHDPAPVQLGWQSGQGHPSMNGTVDQAAFNRCIYLVDKYKDRPARLSVQVHKFVGVR